MVRLHRSNINISNIFGTLSMLCACIYGLVHFLNTVYIFPNRLDAIIRVGIAVFGFLQYIKSWKINIKIYKFSFFTWYLGILFISLFSSLYSPSTVAEYRENIIDILIIGTAFCGVCNDYKNIKKFLLLFSVCGPVLFATLYFNNLLYVDRRLGITLTGDNTNQFALYVMLLVYAAIAGFYFSNKKIVKAVEAIAFVLDMYMLMLSGGRKYVIAPLIMIAIIAVLSGNQKNILRKIIVVIVVAVGVSLLWDFMMTNSIIYNSIGNRFANNVSLSSRETYIRYGFQFWLRSPVWGYGENAFSELIYPIVFKHAYAHNNYIELMVNFGLIGLIWYYGLYIYAFRTIANDKSTIERKLKNYLIGYFIASFFIDAGIVTYSSSSLIFLFNAICFSTAWKIYAKQS